MKIAVIIPCYNEEVAISSVIEDFRRHLPGARICVFDNNSSDNTAECARASGAEVYFVALRGKGNVVLRMFSDVDADVYLMVDGDATYDAASSPILLNELLEKHLDMVVGCRQTSNGVSGDAYRRGHKWGNHLLTESVRLIFGGYFTDMLSGYRVFSRRYAKSFPAFSHGFETETELTVHALELRMPYGEVMTPYGARPEGSVSKLSTYRDGWRILKTIGRIYISERPLQFFSICAFFLALLSVLLSLPLLNEYLQEGLVPRLPTAVLSASLMLSSLLSFSCGLILDNVTQGRREMKRLAYLSIPLPHWCNGEQ